jgi:ornithine cyclodeaminase/alanine dehydrogenase-like protein (mu-crystallin family)
MDRSMTVNIKQVLLLRPQDVKDVIDIGTAIDLVEQGYSEATARPMINAPRRRVHSKANVRVSNFPGGVDGLNVIGSMTRGELVAHEKNNQNIAQREHPVFLLWNAETGHLETMMIGEITEKTVGVSSIMALRTAATTGVGFRHLVRKNATKAGVFGSGGMALHKILALQNERKIQTYKVFSRNKENRVAFCQRLAKLIPAEFIPVETPREVIEGVDVVICATSSNVPVFDGRWLEPGQHVVTVVGSNSALVEGGWLKSGRRENDDETVRRADFIITNWLESVKQERQAGLIDPIEAGIIGWEKIHELGELPLGKIGRTTDEQITYHANNNGTAAADMALAKWVSDECRKMGRGIKIDLPLAGDQ